MLGRLKNALGRRIDSVRERVGAGRGATPTAPSAPRPSPSPVAQAPVVVAANERPAPPRPVPVAEAAPPTVTAAPAASVVEPEPLVVAPAETPAAEVAAEATAEPAPKSKKGRSDAKKKPASEAEPAAEAASPESKPTVQAEVEAKVEEKVEPKAEAKVEPAAQPMAEPAAAAAPVATPTVAPEADGHSSIAARALALAKGKTEAKIVHADMGSTDLEHYIARAKANNRDLSTIKGGVGMNVAEDGEKFWGPVDNSSSRAKAQGHLLTIDQWECISCGTCVEQTDRVFYLPDDGKATPIAQDGPMDLIEDAIEACPVTCIHWVTEDEAGERGLTTGLEPDAVRPD